MEDMKRRIGRADLKQEKIDAIEVHPRAFCTMEDLHADLKQAICDIALDRVDKLGEELEA